jgi:valyl-tRNA synthetase
VALRNARATAGLPAAAWLETHLAAAGDAHELLADVAPAVARLARARPLAIHDTPAALPRPDGALEVVLPSGGIEASVVVGESSAAGGDADRTRLEKELAAAEGHLAAARARLANASFTERAPAAVVEGARRSEAELADQVERLRARLSS